MSKITMAAAAAAGYVLGARAGRERYDEIVQKAEKAWSNPKVQKGKRRAQEKAEEKTGKTSSDDTSSVQDLDSPQDNQFNV
ncbi:MAG TPA: hypothetical protein VJ976_07670 [Ornithinimicrobium sp.]|uniref:hypothetical protein n=1 Tax=Ornithinimicrobium sp. TaxID=1977084 RepID=UPI002B45D425|nr:hypothetical protein [Ornithinimicrobium sp.]HKJ12255.1 hypothetical protein [Ornithinimicrobium sp.]